ncbi:MAG TPA: hypothetical protein VIF02_12840 [Methylocella sp.]|jgi:hypothetical protein
MTFKIGDFIGVKCEVQPGPFSEELLVTIETTDGAISGFVRDTELRNVGNGWEVRAKVRRINPDSIEVWILGSFFTTNGIASVPTHRTIAA